MNQLVRWYWRSLSLNGLTGSEVFERLFWHNSHNFTATLLESPYPTPKDYPFLSRYSICAGSPRQYRGKWQLWTPSIGEILPFLNKLLTKKTNNDKEIEHLPFTGGWLGWLGYDLAWEIEKLPQINPDPLPFPVAYWYEPENIAILDHHEQILWLGVTVKEDLDKLAKKLDVSENDPDKWASNSLNLTFLSSQSDYEQAVCRAKQYIQAGDIFQANLSLRFQADTKADSWSIYRALQRINPSPFASYWRTPWGEMISCSPERLVQLQGKQAQTRPIAGTRKRGQNPEQERTLIAELLKNVKERAEHIMLVDLERNDLGRVCEWGSVTVDELLQVERYSHVIHLVSNIIGTLKTEYNAIDLIRALFPGGTITGCPKVRCMEIIEELEPFRRNLFYGSCGYLDQRGQLDLNILIRTLLFSPQSEFNRVWGQVGAGIVADSDPEKEWYESMSKAQAQIMALESLI